MSRSNVHPVFARILDFIAGPAIPELGGDQPYVPAHHDDAIDPLAPQMRSVELSAYHDEHKGWDKLEADLSA